MSGAHNLPHCNQGNSLLHRLCATPQHDGDDDLVQVVGEQEMKEQTVNVRTRDMEQHGMHSLTDLTAKLLEENSSRSLTSAFKKSNGLRPSNQEPVAAAAAAAKAEQSDHHQFDKARVN